MKSSIKEALIYAAIELGKRNFITLTRTYHVNRLVNPDIQTPNCST